MLHYITFSVYFSFSDRGWQFLETWLNNLNGKNNHNSRNANPDCYTSMKANTFCRLTNATLEFSKVKIHAGESRSFEKGFVKTYGKGTGAKVEVAPGYFHSTKESFQHVQSKCDVWERRPTFVLSNDDSFNLSHYINDVIMMWSMLLLSGRNGLESLMINFDGIRKGGPAGGVAHKIVKRGQPDAHGPFGLYVDSWFQEVNTAVSYGQKHVCFSEIYFQYFPGLLLFAHYEFAYSFNLIHNRYSDFKVFLGSGTIGLEKMNVLILAHLLFTNLSVFFYVITGNGDMEWTLCLLLP